MPGLASGSGIVLVNETIPYARALVRIEELMLGVRPTTARKSASADRAIFMPGPTMTRFIINVAARRMHHTIGWHTTARSFDIRGTEKRIEAAERVAAIFREEGLEPVIYRHAEPEFPPDFLIFITDSKRLGTHAILLGPTEEDVKELPPEVLKTFPPPCEWSANVFNRNHGEFGE